MSLQQIDAKMLTKMFLAGAKNLESKKEWINELNVFPVPDGDTGTNMTMTIMSAAKELNALGEDADMEAVCKAISSGSLRGARGNSGVILSQLFRGFTKVIKTQNELTIPVIAEALEKAVETAYKAVMKPKEGTILTVAKGVSDKAVKLYKDGEKDMETFFRAIIEHAELVLSKTPDMLPVLKQAGVVDSGGQGLVEVLHGAFDAYMGKEIDFEVASAPASAKPEGGASQSMNTSYEAQANAEIKFGYCTEFIILLNGQFDAKTETDFKAFLESIGDSIVCVADEDVVKVHVHTNDPGLAIQRALQYGALSNMKIDNMRLEHQEKLFKMSEQGGYVETETAEPAAAESQTAPKQTAAAEPVTEAKSTVTVESTAAAGTTAEAVNVAEESPEAFAVQEDVEDIPASPHKKVGFIAVSAGEGLNEIFQSLGVDYIIEGGQTMNPSTADILDAVDKVNAETIFILPNNKNIILAANQAAELMTDKNLFVIPTKSIPQGITAVINYVPELSVDENEETMLNEIGNVKTGQVTYAVRDTVIDDIEIKKNDFMGLGDKGILSVGLDMKQVTAEMVAAMVDENAELISVYYGADVSAEDAEELRVMLEKGYPYCDIELQYGGQPIYYYVVSVE